MLQKGHLVARWSWGLRMTSCGVCGDCHVVTRSLILSGCQLLPPVMASLFSLFVFLKILTVFSASLWRLWRYNDRIWRCCRQWVLCSMRNRHRREYDRSGSDIRRNLHGCSYGTRFICRARTECVLLIFLLAIVCTDIVHSSGANEWAWWLSRIWRVKGTNTS